MVDADGDIALRPVTGRGIWRSPTPDPVTPLATLRWLRDWSLGRLGIATSGTSVHRWPDAGGARHHLIDPRRADPPSRTSCRRRSWPSARWPPRSIAKAAVIAGSEDGLDLADRAGRLAEVLLLDDGDVIATPRTMEWLA